MMKKKQIKSEYIKDLDTINGQINLLATLLTGSLTGDELYSARNQLIEYMRFKHDLLIKINTFGKKERRVRNPREKAVYIP